MGSATSIGCNVFDWVSHTCERTTSATKMQRRIICKVYSHCRIYSCFCYWSHERTCVTSIGNYFFLLRAFIRIFFIASNNKIFLKAHFWVKSKFILPLKIIIWSIKSVENYVCDISYISSIKYVWDAYLSTNRFSMNQCNPFTFIKSIVKDLSRSQYYNKYFITA